MKWYKRFGVQIAIVSVFALVLGFALFIVFRSNDLFGNISDAVSAAISTLGALSVGGVAVIQLRKHKIYEEQAELDRQVKIKQLDAMDLERKVKQADFDRAYSYRIGDAVARLQDKSLGVRLGSLHELEKLCIDSSEESRKLVDILATFIREHIENTEWLLNPLEKNSLKRIDDDVYRAGGEMIFGIYATHKIRTVLPNLQAEKIDLWGLHLCGANLENSNFKGANLKFAQFQNTLLFGASLANANLEGINLMAANLKCVDFEGANLQGADFWKANIMGAKNLTMDQLLSANIDDTTLLGSDLRAKYDRLKAEHDATPAS